MEVGSIINKRTVLGALCTALLVSCSDQHTPSELSGPQSTRSQSLAVEPSTVVLDGVGGQATLVATDSGDPITNSSLRWTSADPSVATVDAEGHVTAQGEGTTQISAGAGCCDNIAYATVTVTGSPASIRITPENPSVVAGGTTTLTATVYDAYGNALSGYTPEWLSSNTSIATVSQGVVKGVAAGTAKVRAVTSGLADTVSVSVLAESSQTVAVVSVSPSTASVAVSKTVQLSATVSDPYGNPITGQTVTWSSSNPGVASVTSAGLVTAVAAGTATITAAAGGKYGSAQVTVTAPSTIATVTINPASGAINVGGTLQLAATARDANGNALSGYTFAWSSMNPAIASVNATGLVSGLSAGTATISASAEGKIGSATVTVSTPTVARVVASPDTVRFTALGGVSTVSASAYDANGQQLSGVKISWATSNAGIATVDSLGRVTARGTGIALIIASALCCEKADTLTTIVTQQIAAVAVSPHSTSIPAGSTSTITATAYDANQNVIPSTSFSWSSSNTQIVSVSGGVVSGLAAGTAVVRAVSGTFRDSSIVTVTSSGSTTPVLTSITLTPTSASLLIGDSVRFTANAKDQNGNAMTGVTFNWTSSNTSIMTVSQGMVRALAAGAAILHVSSGSISDSATVTVSTPPPAGSYATPDIAWTDIENGTTGAFVTSGNGSNTGNTDINIISDPTGQFGGHVARIHFQRISTTQSLDVNRSLKYTLTSGLGLGQTIYFRGHVLIPTPAANMAQAMRKLFYVQRQRDFTSFAVIKADGNELRAEITRSRVFSAGAGSFPFNKKISIEVQITTNSALGKADGILRIWKDGALVISATNVEWLTTTEPFSVFLFGQQTQNSLNDTSILFDEYRYWDNLAISTRRIGP